ALAGQRLALVLGAGAALPGGIVLADEDGEQGVVAELVMVVEVLVAQAQAEDALLEEVRQGVLDLVGVAVVPEAAGQLVEEVEPGLEFAEEQPAGIGGDGGAVEAGDDVARSEAVEKQIGGVTRCQNARASWVGRKGLWQNPLCQLRGRRARALVRNAG